MNISMVNSLVSMNALQQKIDTIADNLANINTHGYKSREVFFQEILTSQLQQPEKFQLDGRITAMGLNQGFGSKVGLTLVNHNQGTQIETGINTDLMLLGENVFFTIAPPNQDGSDLKELRYTRNGHFQLDANRYLVTDYGDLVLNTEGEPINVPAEATFQVNEKGRVLAHYSNGESEELGAIQITKMISSQVLEKVGKNQYQIPRDLFIDGESALKVNIIDEEFNMEEESGNSHFVIQGSLEGSNTDLSKEMTQLTEAQRAYQLLSRGLSISDQMMGIANNIRG